MPSGILETPARNGVPVPPRQLRPRRSIAVWVIPIVYVGASLFGLWWMGVSPSSLQDGFGDIGRLLSRMVPPTTGPIPGLLTLLVQTLLIAIAGTGLATIASIPLAAASSSRFTGPRPVQWAARLVIVLTRAVPTLIFAIIFVRIFGLGPMAGGLAVAFHSVGMIGKLMTDIFEEQDRTASEAVSATGASRLRTFVATTFSRALPSITGVVLYRLDINIRASAILGIVGAGGIGVALQTAIGSLNYPRAAGIVLVIIAVLLILEVVSVRLQVKLSEHARESSRSQLFVPGRAVHQPGWDRARVARTVLGSSALLVFLYALWSLEADLERISRSLPSAVELVGGMFPPEFSGAIFLGVFESVLMAVTATTVGVLIGLVIAVLSTDLLVRISPLAVGLRGLTVLMRGIPDIIYALIFVAALGLGPFAGFLALSISCTALAAKFFTDSLQNLSPAPLKALEATGANRLQVFISGVWPQFVPSFLGNSLFTSDLALRESAVLGIVGAGGIGFLLHESVATLNYETTSAILISLIAVVLAIESAARWIRSRVL